MRILLSIWLNGALLTFIVLLFTVRGGSFSGFNEKYSVARLTRVDPSDSTKRIEVPVGSAEHWLLMIGASLFWFVVVPMFLINGKDFERRK